MHISFLGLLLAIAQNPTISFGESRARVGIAQERERGKEKRVRKLDSGSLESETGHFRISHTCWPWMVQKLDFTWRRTTRLQLPKVGGHRMLLMHGCHGGSFRPPNGRECFKTGQLVTHLDRLTICKIILLKVVNCLMGPLRYH